MCNDGLFVVSLPRLIDFDWRVDVKTSSDSVMRMAVPTCLVQMKVSDVDLVKSSLCLHFHCQIRTLLILCWSSVAILEKGNVLLAFGVGIQQFCCPTALICD